MRNFCNLTPILFFIRRKQHGNSMRTAGLHPFSLRAELKKKTSTAKENWPEGSKPDTALKLTVSELWSYTTQTGACRNYCKIPSHWNCSQSRARTYHNRIRSGKQVYKFLFNHFIDLFLSPWPKKYFHCGVKQYRKSLAGLITQKSVRFYI